MFVSIRHPIRSIRVIRYIATQITPEDKARIDAAETPLEKSLIQDEILTRIFPELA